MLGPLRLLLRRAASPLLLLALLRNVACEPTAYGFSSLSTTEPAAPTTCKRLTDADSPFLSSLSLLRGLGGAGAAFSDPTIFTALDHALPTLSQCVAETKPLELLSSLAEASSPQAQQCVKALTTLSASAFVDANGTILFRDAVCPAFATLAPCLTDVLVPEIVRAMADADDCCAPLREQIAVWFGASLQPAVTSLVHILGNTFCSERSTLAAPSATANCGDSLLKNWQPPTNGDDEKAYWDLLNSFQIPNDQACKAARGEPIVTTMNKTQQFGAPGVAPYGICFTPLDAMQQYVRALPLWRVAGGVDTANMVERVYVADSCLAGKEFLKWATDDDAAFMKGVRVADDLITTLTTVFGAARNATTTTTSPSGSPSPTTASPKPTPQPTTTETPLSSSDDSSSNDSDGSDEDMSEEDEPAVFDFDEGTEAEEGPTLEELAGANWTEIVRTKLWELNLVASQLCVHIPNGVPCTFPGEVLTVPFPQLMPTSVESGSGSGAVPSGSSAPAPQPSGTAATLSPSAVNSSTTNSSSSAVGMRQHHDSALTAVAITMIAALIVQLL